MHDTYMHDTYMIHAYMTHTFFMYYCLFQKNAILLREKSYFSGRKSQKNSGHGPKNIQNNPLYYGGGENRLLWRLPPQNSKWCAKILLQLVTENSVTTGNRKLTLRIRTCLPRISSHQYYQVTSAESAQRSWVGSEEQSRLSVFCGGVIGPLNLRGPILRRANSKPLKTPHALLIIFC